MGKKIVTSGAIVLLAFAGSPVLSVTFAAAQSSTPVLVSGKAAGGHEEVETLKAELAALQTKLSNTETGREFLVTRLEEVLTESKAKDEAAAAMTAENTDLLKSLRFMTDNRDYLVDEMSMTNDAASAEVDELKAANTALEVSLAKAKKGRKFLSEKYLANRTAQKAQQASNTAAMAKLEKDHARDALALERALRGKSYLRGRLDEAEASLATLEKSSARDSLALERALRGKSYLRGRLDETEASLATLEKSNSRDSLALERALRGKSYLRSRLDETEASLATLEKDNNRDSLALERALRGKSYLRGRLDEAEASLATLEKNHDRDSLALERALRGKAYLRGLVDELEAKNEASQSEMDALASVSFAQIESAIAERDAVIEKHSSTAWADELSASLTESFGSQSNTEVTALSNNSVAIKVGNTGLFSAGSVNLSAGGRALLGEIGQELISRDNAQIRVIGHTDNVPTGSGSRFASNNELSLARATSALSYLSSVGVPAERLAASGVGDAYPIASNDSEEGRLANRRVEILLTPAE